MKGTIVKSTGSWYDIITENGERFKGRLRGKFKIQGLNATNPIAVGDKVEFENDEKGEEGSVSITHIFPRENYIIRKAVKKSSQGHLIASNIDQSILIVTMVYPVTSTGFIDRFLVSSETFRIPAIVVFNKTDLYRAEDWERHKVLKATYEKIGYHCIETSALENKGIESLKSLLKNKISLMSGHSGVGKSTLINSVSPGLELRTDELSNYTDKGKHTTTFAEMFELEKNTYLIDTPGIKELGLFEIGEEELSHYFPEMRELLGRCKFNNCKHVNEPKCAVIEKVKSGEIAVSRYESYLRMLSGEDDRN